MTKTKSEDERKMKTTQMRRNKTVDGLIAKPYFKLQRCILSGASNVENKQFRRGRREGHRKQRVETHPLHLYKQNYRGSRRGDAFEFLRAKAFVF